MKKTLCIFWAFILISPIVSFAARKLLAQDTAGAVDAVDTAGSEPLPPRSLVYTITIEGAIGTVTNDRIELAIKRAEEDGAELLVILLDTPGGFTRATWAICKNILNSKVPVCMYIAPSGARAGSAGVYMTYASHIAAMAPSTNIGAAHPVGGGGEEIDSVMNEKVTNDAVAQIRAAAEKRGRNAEWAEKAVRESVAITDNEALELHVIDLRAENTDDLLEQLDGRTIETVDGDKVLALGNATRKEIPTSFVHRILDLITQPDIAFILMSIGGLGIMLELYNPGAIFPGVIGAISLILAFYAFQTLPINYAGMALLLLSALLFIAEIKIVSHGLLTVGGVVSFFFGGLMLVDTVDPALRISKSLLVTMTAVIGLSMGTVILLYLRAASKRPAVGNEGMIGKTGQVRKNGHMYVDGALWRIESTEQLEVGDRVQILEINGLTMKVKRTD